MKIHIEAESIDELVVLLERITGGKGGALSECHINALPLSARTRNALVDEKIETISQLSMCSENDLARVPNLGRRSIDEIRGVLAARGVAVRP